MSCEEIIRDILLESSGELDEAGRRRLQAHLARCPTCRTYRESLHQVEQVVHSTIAGPIVSAVTADTILTELARRRRSWWARVAEWVQPHPALAWAGAVVVAFITGFTLAVMVAQWRFSTPTTAQVEQAGHAWSWGEWLDERLNQLDRDLDAVAREVQTASESDLLDPDGILDEFATQILPRDT
jgi:anti-sigma factor RsiW